MKKKLRKKKTEACINTLQGFKVGDLVWIRYHTGKLLEGTVSSFTDSEKEGPTVTILTNDMGFRTTKIENCSFLKSDL